ncbi:MAG: hypothetical protein JWM16_899 [Verrucomicrobiales bacterium]|nr:hypothetical protein [Verrucomicrobiales bacterium]
MESRAAGIYRNVCKDCEALTEDHSPFAEAAASQAMVEKALEPVPAPAARPVAPEPHKVR